MTRDEQTANEPLTIVYNGKAVTVDADDLQDVADFFQVDVTEYADMHGYDLTGPVEKNLDY